MISKLIVQGRDMRLMEVYRCNLNTERINEFYRLPVYTKIAKIG